MGNNNDWNNGQKKFNPEKKELPPIIFYKDGKINPNLFCDDARKIAECFGEKKNESQKGKKIGISQTQIRRIYNEVKRFEPLIVSDEKFKENEAYLRMIQSKVEYSVTRGKIQQRSTSAYWDNLSDFFTQCLKQVKSKKDYKVFVSLFEAVYCFYYDGENKNN